MSEAQDEEAFTKEGKYQKFQYVVERALKNFELSSQWTDLVSHLTTLHKVWALYNTCIIELGTQIIQIVSYIHYTTSILNNDHLK